MSALAALRAAVRKLRDYQELSNIIWLAAGEGTGKAGFLVANLYLARVLQPAHYGLMVVAQSLTYYAWQGTDLGTTMFGIREISRSSRETEDEVAGVLLSLRVVVGLIGTVVCLSAVAVWPLPGSARIIYEGACCYLLTRAVYPDFVFKGLRRFRALAVGSVGSGLTFLVLVVVIIHSPAEAGIATYLWSLSWLVGGLLLIAYLRWGMRLRIHWHVSPRAWLEYLRASIQFAYTGILLLFYDTLPILLTGVLLGGVKLGLFAAVYRLLLSLTGASYLVAMALYPTLSQLHAQNFRRFTNMHRTFRNLMVIGGAIAALGGVVCARPVILLLLGSRYTAAIPAFRILSVDLLCYAVRFTYGITLGASGNQKYYTIASLLGLAVLAVTFIPAVKTLGIAGAAASVVIADAAVGAGLGYVCYRVVRPEKRRDSPARNSEVRP